MSSVDTREVIKRMLEELTRDPVGLLVVALLWMGVKSAVGSPVEDDIRWLLEEVDRCEDEECVEKTVRELVSRLRARRLKKSQT
jgi:hypothetical protein